MKILNNKIQTIPKIHWFNPGHEDAIRTDNPHYTPPAPVCRMMTDLAILPVWYGNKNDYVIVNETDETSRFLWSLPAAIRPAATPIRPAGLNMTEPVEAAPWGLSPHSVRFFETLRALNTHIIIPPWKETRKELTGRQTALKCLSKITTLLPDNFKFPRFCATAGEIREYITAYPPPYILKTPYSCSGRGLFRLPARELDLQATRWIEGALRKQGAVSIEPALDKVCDFAMEFESGGKGNISFKGLAVFNTLAKGTYYGNLLGSQAAMENHLSAFIQISQLRTIQETLTPILAETFGYDYQGYLGVDMLIYRKDGLYFIHPMIEINLRYTMGLVALQLSNRWIHPASQGQLIIAFNKDPQKTTIMHLQMKAEYPLQLSGAQIRSGYLSLCPVLSGTQYLAYMLIYKP